MTATPTPQRSPEVHPPLEAVREVVARALAEDLLPIGDLTAALVPADAATTLHVVARAAGVIAGQRCVQEVYGRLDDTVTVEWLAPDGTAVAPGTAVARLTGPLRPILTGERTALNLLGHLSGVATLTRRFVDAVRAVSPSARILDTRKTTPGLRALEKAAVRAGGGRNHRGNLSEAVLVKDNHLGALAIADAVALARQTWPGRMVEVECDTEAQVVEASAAGADLVMLDNMSPDRAAAAVLLARRHAVGRLLVEVSGGITLQTAPAYAQAGVDLLSVGALTHSAPVLDLGLDLA